MDIRTAPQCIRDWFFFGLRLGYMNGQRPSTANWWIYQGWLEGTGKANYLTVKGIVDHARRVFQFEADESHFRGLS